MQKQSFYILLRLNMAAEGQRSIAIGSAAVASANTAATVAAKHSRYCPRVFTARTCRSKDIVSHRYSLHKTIVIIFFFWFCLFLSYRSKKKKYGHQDVQTPPPPPPHPRSTTLPPPPLSLQATKDGYIIDLINSGLIVNYGFCLLTF